MTCGITQNIIKNYASYVINWTRQLARMLRRKLQAFALVRASSLKRQASSPKLFKMKETSVKLQAARFKLQAASIKVLNILPLIKFYLVKGEGLNHNKCILRMVTMK